MDQVVPWAALVELIAPYYPEGKTDRPLFSLMTMLHIHFMQQWSTLSNLLAQPDRPNKPLRCRRTTQAIDPVAPIIETHSLIDRTRLDAVNELLQVVRSSFWLSH
jgi:hypothetical protein